MRLFLAGPLPDDVQASLFSALGAARRAASQARWVRPGQLHLTLAFFGETEASRLPSLVEALRAVAPRHPAAVLALRGAGCFGRPHQPNVLFAELAGEVEAVRALEADIRGTLGPVRGEDAVDVPFRPHLTLARARSRQGDLALSRCRRALQGQALGTFVLDRMVLYQSQLLAGGAEYTPLLELPLGIAPSLHA